PHGADISWSGFAWNQIWVVMGNVVGGAVFVGGAYWMASPVKASRPSTKTVIESTATASPLAFMLPVEQPPLKEKELLSAGRDT
ncbi:MAG: hypothetical protein VST67_01145, partial [Nitrospirota bacterium]|nr:hypothetical protein [Nitrospirota bacterium]